MKDKEKFPRLVERLLRTVPHNRVERIHEFVTDLAIGFDEGAWDASIYCNRYQSEIFKWRVNGANKNQVIQDMLDSKWPKNLLPDIDALCSLNYLEVLPEGEFSLSGRALHLADAPTTIQNVFISYKRDKSSEFALLFDSRINYETNATPFVDHNLKPGEEWHAKLKEKIANSDAFICLLAPGTLCSPFVQKEINWALTERENNNRLIVPVWHKGYVSKPNSKCDKISVKFQAVEVLTESAKYYNSAVDEVLNRLGYSTAFLDRRRQGSNLIES